MDKNSEDKHKLLETRNLKRELTWDSVAKTKETNDAKNNKDQESG